MENLKFIFFGNSKISSNTLEILKGSNYLPSLIITFPDKPKGRNKKISFSSVKEWAIKNNINYLQPEKLDNTFINEIKKLKSDLIIVVSYGKILPKELIDIPIFGSINLHYSLLPKYRGASPIESALLNGDTQTGISIQKIIQKLDSGPIINKIIVPIYEYENKFDLTEKLIQIGGKLLCDTINNINNISLEIQNEKHATYCKKIKKKDGEISIKTISNDVYNKYKAFYGWPGLYFFVYKKDKKIRVNIKKASFINNMFIIEKVIVEGKKEIDYNDFLKQDYCL